MLSAQPSASLASRLGVFDKHTRGCIAARHVGGDIHKLECIAARPVGPRRARNLCGLRIRAGASHRNPSQVWPCARQTCHFYPGQGTRPMWDRHDPAKIVEEWNTRHKEDGASIEDIAHKCRYNVRVDARKIEVLRRGLFRNENGRIYENVHEK